MKVQVVWSGDDTIQNSWFEAPRIDVQLSGQAPPGPRGGRQAAVICRDDEGREIESALFANVYQIHRTRTVDGEQPERR